MNRLYADENGRLPNEVLSHLIDEPVDDSFYTHSDLPWDADTLTPRISAGSGRVIIDGESPRVPVRILSEENYQLAVKSVNRLAEVRGEIDLTSPPAKMGDILDTIRRHFATFGGGHGHEDEWNPLRRALADQRLQFAAGVDVADVVRLVARELGGEVEE